MAEANNLSDGVPGKAELAGRAHTLAKPAMFSGPLALTLRVLLYGVGAGALALWLWTEAAPR